MGIETVDVEAMVNKAVIGDTDMLVHKAEEAHT